MDKLYPVALVSFLAHGGSYLYNFPEWIESLEIGDVDYAAFKQYVAENSPINMTTEGRITVNYHDTPSYYAEGRVGMLNQIELLMIMCFLMIISTRSLQ